MTDSTDTTPAEQPDNRDDDLLAAIHGMSHGGLLCRWSPPQNSERLPTDDTPQDYAVFRDTMAPGGCVVYGWYDRRGEWVCNPPLRALVRHLLNAPLLRVQCYRCGKDHGAYELGDQLYMTRTCGHDDGDGTCYSSSLEIVTGPARSPAPPVPAVERGLPASPDAGGGQGNVVDAIILAVAELPDRTSPDNWPEAMLVTADELRQICRPLAESLELAREGMRLRDKWVRESDKRGDIFRDERARLAAANTTLRAEVEQLRAVVGKLPTTADGVPIGPDSFVCVVWHGIPHKCAVGGIWGHGVDAYHDGEPVAGLKYSTEAAALASASPGSGEDTAGTEGGGA